MNKSQPTSAQCANLFQTDFLPAELTDRRAEVFVKIGENAVAVLQGAPLPGGFDLFRQSNELYYLCGIEVPHSYLLLDGRNSESTLFMPSHDPNVERSEGPVLHSDDPELVKSLTGVDAVKKPDELSRDIEGAKSIYVPHSPAEGSRMSRDTLLHANKCAASDPWDGLPTREDNFIQRLKNRYPNAEIQNLSPILDSLRIVKSPAEIEVMRRAGRLIALAVAEAIRSTKPGVMEYQLGAIADYVFLVNGARGGGYRAIIAGGANAWHGHYYRNNCELHDGDLVLMDYAPDCGNYTSDIGRMWPVNGKYAPWQRELYGFIVEYHKTLLRLIRPGVMAEQIMKEAADEMKKAIEETSFSKPCYEKAARQALEFRGHLSHSVGMAVHDVGGFRDAPLRPGTVFALDPQMWIPEEDLYIRVEDTVVVTQDGIENLTSLAPVELDDVENVMKEDGILQEWPPLENAGNDVIETH